MKTLLAALLLVSSSAFAVQLPPQGCQALAEFVKGIADVRDLKADRKLHIESLLVANAEMGLEMLALIKNEFDKVYDQPKIPPVMLAQEVFRRCLRNRGDMGMGT